MTPPPPWIRLVAPPVALLLAAATVLEHVNGAGEFGTREAATAAGTGLAVLAAAFLPLTGLLLTQLVVLVPALADRELGRAGGAWLITLLVLVAHLAYRRPLRPALVGYVIASTVPATTIVLAGEALWEFVFFPLILAPGFGVGLLLRREQARSAQLQRLARELAAERELRARSAVVEERARISRELHDAVAHTVSVMTLQIGVVRRALGRGGPAGTAQLEALAAAEGLGRQSVDELRRVVGILREDGGPELSPRASLEHLAALAEQITAAGVPVRTVETGTPRRLPPALDMSAYRIVQEALTNTLRHGGRGATAQVGVTWSPNRLVLEVTDRAGGERPTSGAEDRGDGGHGLVGMRERVDMFGGRLEAGPAAHGWRVRAELPVGGTEEVA